MKNIRGSNVTPVLVVSIVRVGGLEMEMENEVYVYVLVEVVRLVVVIPPPPGLPHAGPVLSR